MYVQWQYKYIDMVSLLSIFCNMQLYVFHLMQSEWMKTHFDQLQLLFLLLENKMEESLLVSLHLHIYDMLFQCCLNPNNWMILMFQIFLRQLNVVLLELNNPFLFVSFIISLFLFYFFFVSFFLYFVCFK